jgi:hypothetical protein
LNLLLHADAVFCFATACRLLNLLMHSVFWICYCMQTFDFATVCRLLNLLLHADLWICSCM